MLPGRLFTDCHSQYRAMPQATVETFFVVHNCIRRAKCAFVVTHFSSLHLWCSVRFIPPALRYILHFDILQGRFYPHDCAFLGLLLLVFDWERDLFGLEELILIRICSGRFSFVMMNRGNCECLIKKNIAMMSRCEAAEWVGESLGTGLDPSIPIISLHPLSVSQPWWYIYIRKWYHFVHDHTLLLQRL